MLAVPLARPNAVGQNKFDSASAELERSTTYKMQVAQREHLELASTIRQRLLNSVTKKRERLLREKEQLDIADSNSLFLHPSQFSINIPGSPGGVHSNRKTRHTRHRLGEPEDAPVERGRKRKIAAEDDGNDSSAPPFRPASAPYHDARAKTLYTQYEAPAYSVERLFTDKELTHATTVAQFATHNFFHHQQPLSQGAANGSLVNGHDTAVPSLDGSVDAAIAATIITADGEDQALAATSNGSPPPSQLAAQDMERTVSYHATRHATKANPLSFLSEAAAAVSSTPALVNPFIPALVPITKTDKGAPTPPAINGLDVDNDLALMLQGDTNDTSMNGAASTSTYEDDNAARNEHNINAVRGRFLEQALRDPISTQPFRLPLLETGPAAIQGGVNRPAHFGFADPASMPNGLRNGVTTAVASTSTGLGSLAAALGGVAGGLPMSRATSMAGSEIGAPSEPGGVGVGGAGMRRVRSRLI